LNVAINYTISLVDIPPYTAIEILSLIFPQPSHITYTLDPAKIDKSISLKSQCIFPEANNEIWGHKLAVLREPSVPWMSKEASVSTHKRAKPKE